MEKILTAFCYTDIHNQQSMLDYPTTVRKSLVQAKELAIEEFGAADLAIVGGDNISDYPYWNKSCALPKKNFLDLKAKMHACISESVKGGKVLYVAGNNDMILGDIATEENEPYNTTDFYDLMDAAFGALPDSEKIILTSDEKPKELYWGAFHYVVNGIDFIGINIDPNTAFNSHEGCYTEQTLTWVKNKMNEIDPDGKKCVFVIISTTDISAKLWTADAAKCSTIYSRDTETLFISTATFTERILAIESARRARYCTLMTITSRLTKTLLQRIHKEKSTLIPLYTWVDSDLLAVSILKKTDLRALAVRKRANISPAPQPPTLRSSWYSRSIATP